MLLKNCKIILKDNQTKIVDIKIKDSYIEEIGENLQDDEIIDIKSNLVLAGGIDVHTHLREPGFEKKETIKTGTKAAASGGYTTIFAMPNLKPYPDSKENLQNYLEIIKKDAIIKVIPYCTITKGEKGEELVDFAELCGMGMRYFSDDGVGVQDKKTMLKAMQKAKEFDAFIVAHTEDNSYLKPGACVNEGKISQKLGLVGIPNECEYKQVQRDLELAKISKAKYHICHISTKESVQALRKALKEGVDASGEVTTHHLLLNEDDVKDTNYKMNPPLRSEQDRIELINALKDGTIKIIANDHAPHTYEDKNKEFSKAAFGVVSLESSMALLFTYLVKKGILTLEEFSNLTSLNPAKRFNLEKVGQIKEGNFADLFVLEEGNFKIDKNKFFSLGKNTPFDGYSVDARVVLTICNGKVVFDINKDMEVK